MPTSEHKREARSASVHDPPVTPTLSRPAPSGTAPFRLGFRERAFTTPDGQTVLRQIPLTAEDLLYPQEGDIVSDGFPHNWFLHPLADAMRRYLGKRLATLVVCNTMLVLGDGKNAGPDVAVIEGEIDLPGIRRAINLRSVGGRLAFVLEAVSTSEKEIETKDLEKNVKRYAREGVEEYFTVYPISERKVKDLVGRRLSEGGEYEEIAPDADGGVVSQKLGLRFFIDPESKELMAVDAQSGQRLLTSDEEEARADREAEARRQAEERAEKEAEARHQAEQALRRKVADLCGLLGIEWTAEHSTAVAAMGTAQLETLWADLMTRKRWP